MNLPLSRRRVLAAPLALAGCATAKPYFGKTTPPASQRLVHSNGEEPGTLDPAQSVGASSEIIISALLDSLTSLHPFTLEPAAGLATHYEIDGGGTHWTFFLRGHPKPRGIRLPNTDSLPPEFSGARRAPPDQLPALWSDGSPVRAHDFVYAWQRFVDPATAAPMAFYLAPIRNAEDIINGAKPPNTLAVWASDDFTFHFELEAPVPSFLKLLWQPFLAAVPRQSVEAARQRGHASSWTEPGNLICSGPFLLRQWRPYDRIVLSKNPHYWEAQSVGDGGDRLPVSLQRATNVNLYQAGTLHSMDPRLIPPPLVPALARKKDFATAPAMRTFWFLLNVNTHPLDRLAVRYALNLATDKRAIAAFLGAGQIPANGIVPPMAGYSLPTTMPVSIHGRQLNILAFDPRAARELLRAEGIRDFKLSLTFPTLPNIRDVSAIVQRQWREHAGVDVSLTEQGSAEWLQEMNDKRYRHVTQDSWTARCVDLADYLALFGPPAHYSAWTDTAFDSSFVEANRFSITIVDSRPSPRARRSLSGRCQQYRFITTAGRTSLRHGCAD